MRSVNVVKEESQNHVLSKIILEFALNISSHK